MSSNRDATHIVRQWLDDGVTVLPDRVLDTVLDELPTTPQRGARWALAGSRGMLVAAAVLVAVVVGVTTFGEGIGDALRPGSSGPPVSALVPLPLGPLDAGPYVIHGVFPRDIALDIPEGWSKASLGPDHVLIESHPGGTQMQPPQGTVLGFYSVDNLFADPCAADRSMLDPPVGPTVGDLAEAFASLPGYRASAPTTASIDGYQGKRIELELDVYMCPWSQVQLWQTPDGSVRAAFWEEELTTLWILDVDRERVVVTATAHTGTAPDDLDELHAIIESIDFLGPIEASPGN